MNFVKLSMRNMPGRSVFVNLNRVELIRQHGDAGGPYTIIGFQGTEDSRVDVLETPEQILAAIGCKVLECGTTSSAPASLAAATAQQCGTTPPLPAPTKYTFVPNAAVSGGGLSARNPILGYLCGEVAESIPGSIPLVARS